MIVFATIFLCLVGNTFGSSVDCCNVEYSSIGGTCSRSGTTIGNTTYYCVDTPVFGCSACDIASDLDISCSSCCVTSEDACTESNIYILASWSLVCIIFALSCCCCSLVFLAVEQTRTKEGMSFSEAYLLPIPLVSVNLPGNKVDVDIDANENSNSNSDRNGHENGDENGDGNGDARNDSSLLESMIDVVVGTVATGHHYSIDIPVAEPYWQQW